MLSTVKRPVLRSELPQQGVIDLKHIHAVEAGMQSLVAFVVRHGMQHGVIHDLVVITMQRFTD